MRSVVAGLALLVLAAAPSAHAAGNCYKGSEFTNVKLGGMCTAITWAKVTPAMCGTTAMTIAGVNKTFTSTLDVLAEQSFKDVAACTTVFAADMICGAGKVKDGADCGWLCGQSKGTVEMQFQACSADADCAADKKMPACESYTAMMSDVCTLTAAEVDTKIAAVKTGNNCKNKADGGVEFCKNGNCAGTAATTAAPATTPAPSSQAPGVSPVLSLLLASGAASVAAAWSRKA